MANMPPDEASVEVTPGIDVRSLSLSQREGYVLSRAIAGKQRVKDLVVSTGLPLDEARESVRLLVEKGALLLEGDGLDDSGRNGASPANAGAPSSSTSPGTYRDVVFSPADLAEPCDLSEAQKKRILYVEMHLGKWNHYALLGLKRTASQADIKRGYFKASKEFHPDAYFRKNLGSYKARVERIFRAMKQAYDVLNDVEARHRYDDTLGFDFSPEELAELEARAEELRQQEAVTRADEETARQAAERERRLQQRLKEKRLSRNPMVDRMKRARELMALAEQASFAGRLVEAMRHAKLACDFAPHDAELLKRAERYIREGERERARELLRRAEGLLDDGNAAEAGELAEEGAALAGRDGLLLAQAARVLFGGGMNQRALRYAQAATEAAARAPEGWQVLYELCEREEKWHVALRAAEQLVALRPNDKAARERLKHVRRMVK